MKTSHSLPVNKPTWKLFATPQSPLDNLAELN